LLTCISVGPSLWAAAMGYGHQRLQPNRTEDSHDTNPARVTLPATLAVGRVAS
jgi:hypothetical protein